MAKVTGCAVPKGRNGQGMGEPGVTAQAACRGRGLLGAALGLVLGGACGLLAGCPSDQPLPTATAVSCPKELGPKCKVLEDSWDGQKLIAEFHVLIPPETKHDEAEKALQALYRFLVTRRPTPPTQLSAYIYTNEAQFSTPPRSPVAQVTLKSGEKAPTFENKIALELWQQVEQAINLAGRADRKMKRKLEYVAEQDKQKVTITQPFTEGATEEWAKELSFAQAVGHFTEFALELFNNIPDLKTFVYAARWKDAEVLHIEMSRADFQRLRVREVEDKIGQLAGRTFVELQPESGKVNEAAVEKAHQRRRAAEYKKMLDQLPKPQVIISQQLLPK
ncbi:MAG: hypothetical protein U1A78_03130 [Polyangia bacterium]